MAAEAMAAGQQLSGAVGAANGGGRSLLQGTLALNSSGAPTVMDISVQPFDLGGYLDEQLAVLWVLQCAFLVFFMQCGFALLEAGTVRVKNTKNILLKNVIDACVSTMSWWTIGYAFAYGECGENGFIGSHDFFSASASSNSEPTYWAYWLFGWAFSATAATIVSGSMAERTKFRSYMLYTTCISSFIYPVVVHWIWSSSGWLSAHRRPDCSSDQKVPYISGTMGVMDFAGSGVVHMVGGSAALVGSIILGPRLGRFTQDGHVIQFDNSSPANMALGVFILWLGCEAVSGADCCLLPVVVCMYGFNAGSTQCFYGCMPVAAMVAVNTTLATGAGGLTCLFLAVFNGNPGDIGPLLNGILAGAVSITAGCALVQSYAAVIIGCIGALIYTVMTKVELRLLIDDPVEAAPVHFFCGAWGLLSVGFFSTKSSVQMAYGYADDWGVFYGGSGKQLGIQILGICVIAAWSCGLSGAMFFLLKKLGWLRAAKDAELQGLDLSQGIGSGMRGNLGNCFPCLPCCKDDLE